MSNCYILVYPLGRGYAPYLAQILLPGCQIPLTADLCLLKANYFVRLPIEVLQIYRSGSQWKVAEILQKRKGRADAIPQSMDDFLLKTVLSHSHDEIWLWSSVDVRLRLV